MSPGQNTQIMPWLHDNQLVAVKKELNKKSNQNKAKREKYYDKESNT